MREWSVLSFQHHDNKALGGEMIQKKRKQGNKGSQHERKKMQGGHNKETEQQRGKEKA